MSDYLVIWGDLGQAPAQAVLDRLEAEVVGHGGWRWAMRAPDFALLTPIARPPRLHHLADSRGLIIGDLWATGRDEAPDLDGLLSRSAGASTAARALCAGAWGRYVAILTDTEAPAIFRDSSGGLEALTWRCGALTMIASRLTPEILDAVGPPLALDWGRIAGYLASPSSVSGPLALRGVNAIEPGELVALGGQTRTPIWAPAMFVGAPVEPATLAQSRLVRHVDRALRCMTRDRGPVLAEVSGGLDSAIVASALARLEEVEVVQWLNYYGAGAESDERVFAKSIGDLYGLEITCVAKPSRPIDLEGLAANAGGVRPSLMGLDYLRDQDVAQRCVQLGAKAIVTGQGGDAVFLQRLTPLALADQMRREGRLALRAGAVRALADWTGSSAWSVLRQALGGTAKARPARAPSGPAFLTREARAVEVPPHPWLCDLDGVAPGKRQQIERLVQSQLVTGDCQRARDADLLHPLLAQPLVEYSLGLPTDVLTQLQRDRALARQAFSRRLPDAVVQRRSKGDMTGHYGRWVAASLPFLRSFLLEGRLAAQGIIDRERLEALLTAEQLAWGADYVSILFAAVLEAWAQRWEARIRSQVAPR
ncbi:asparagine synthase-related protein [Phenylobacterium sp.]|uniref:asparagine synthase-related protein n=1 Tax=Phenylobacterium sp. TaxID=1871053 RepID=UPI003BAAABC1